MITSILLFLVFALWFGAGFAVPVVIIMRGEHRSNPSSWRIFGAIMLTVLCFLVWIAGCYGLLFAFIVSMVQAGL